MDPIIPATVFVSQSSDISVSGTYFRPPIHYVGMLSAVETAKLALKLALFRRFAKRSDVQAILSLDRFFADSVTASPQVKSKIQFLPDLVPVSADQILAAKSAANGPGNGRIRFLLFGALFRRKGLFETLKAIELLTADVASACEVRFCGQLPDESADARSTITDLLNRSPAEVSLVDRFLLTEDLAIEVASADVILAPYVNHKGSSGTLYWAAAFGKPVIAQDYGLVGKEVREFDLGLTVEVGKPQAIAQAIERFVRGQTPGRNPDRIRKFYHGHTRAEFGRRIEQAMIGH
ncbi:MAG: glycosyltransferase [Pseudomonadota bacterium]